MQVATTLLEMLQVRGYAIPIGFEAAIIEPLIDPVNEYTGEIGCFVLDETIKHPTRNAKGDTIRPESLLVYLIHKLGVKELRSILEMNNTQKHILILTQLDPTALVFTELARQQSDIGVEIFVTSQLQKNPLKHQLQPEEYIVLGYEESQRIIKKFGGNPKELKLMLSTDAVARFLGIAQCEGTIIEYIILTGLNPAQKEWRIIQTSSENNRKT